jgi:REP element-mobilizing transposase RayT
MPTWLSVFVTVGVVIILFNLFRAARTLLFSTPVTAVYPGGVELVGVKLGRRTTYRIVQWLTDPDRPRPCPLVIHLPGGDLAGDALCDWNATAAAAELGSPDELEIWPFRDESGRVVGVSIRLVPGALFSPQPVEVSISGMRIALPLTDEDAVRVLGEPTERRTLGQRGLAMIVSADFRPERRQIVAHTACGPSRCPDPIFAPKGRQTVAQGVSPGYRGRHPFLGAPKGRHTREAAPMPQSLVSLNIHIVFSTKNREPFIDDVLAPRLYGYMGGIVRNTGSVLLAVGGIEDHVHLLVSLGRQVCIADLVRDVKSNSTGWVHDTFPDRAAFAWQAGYGAFSVSKSVIKRVERYIAVQREHHTRETFREEYLRFLREHGLEYDERYVWD